MRYLILLLLSVSSFAQERSFYQILDKATLEETDLYMKEKLGDSPRDEAYRAALYMRRAEYLSGSFNKLDSFKEGKKRLAVVIEQNPGNVEFRFLRLMVQESAPWFLGYSSEIEEDSQLIIGGYSKQSDDLKKVIKDYSKESDSLKGKIE